MKKTIYQLMNEGKIVAMGNIIIQQLNYDDSFNGLEKVLPDEDLVKAFDYFFSACSETDDEEHDIAMWIGLFCFAEGEFSEIGKAEIEKRL